MSEQRLVVDRFEAQRAVVEMDGAEFDLPRWMLPVHAAADDVLSVTIEADGERTVITVRRDPDATRRGKDAARDALRRLKPRDPGGTIDL
ncbi:MAG TPA: DUF3006 domain-containing protein [Gemmatimonadales bacterium]|nr:DUF3006 domain-containing protein [Gemmatimonadales bacterium]